MEDQPDEPQVVVDRATWGAAVAEAERREKRAKDATFGAKVAAIGVSLVALLATFVGFPVVGGFSAMLVSLMAAYVFVTWGVGLALPRKAPGLDELGRTTAAAWSLDLTRDQAARLTRGGRTFGPHWVVTQTDETERVVLEHEILEPEPWPLWMYGT